MSTLIAADSLLSSIGLTTIFPPVNIDKVLSFPGYIVIQIAVNALAVLATDYFVPDVTFNGSFIALLKIAGILTLFNIFLRPIARLLLGPFIFLTFGLLVIIINGALVLFATYWAPELSINSPIGLLGTALMFSVANFLISLARRAK